MGGVKTYIHGFLTAWAGIGTFKPHVVEGSTVIIMLSTLTPVQLLLYSSVKEVWVASVILHQTAPAFSRFLNASKGGVLVKKKMVVKRLNYYLLIAMGQT